MHKISKNKHTKSNLKATVNRYIRLNKIKIPEGWMITQQ